jgi:NADPH:quinone reductase-like Zn-dependent oxidoreductase
MKEALITTGPKVNIVDSEIPKAGKDQVVVKVVFSGSNPKDWKIAGMFAQVYYLSRRPSD